VAATELVEAVEGALTEQSSVISLVSESGESSKDHQFETY
jgi:hypothetical protein